jgi:ribonuclease HII
MMLDHSQEWGLHQLRESRAQTIIGIDEVGLGACAGPLVVCGAVFSCDWSDPAVKDSKQYSGGGQKAHDKRVAVLKKNIDPHVLHKELEVVGNKDIDALGMGDALADAMHRVALRCSFAHPDSAVVIDGINKMVLHRARIVIAIPKGDALVPAVSAASVIAKTTRDALMILSESLYPNYGFEQHMGYPTPDHLEALDKLGPCKIHRRSYKAVQLAIAQRRARGLDLTE